VGIFFVLGAAASTAFYFIGAPTLIPLPLDWFIVIAALFLICALVSFKIAMKSKAVSPTSQAPIVKKQLQPSLKKPLTPTPIKEEVEEPSDGKFTSGHAMGNHWDDAFEKAQGVSTMTEEESEPPDYDKYFDQPAKPSVEELLEARKRAFYSQPAQRQAPEAKVITRPPAGSLPVSVPAEKRVLQPSVVEPLSQIVPQVSANSSANARFGLYSIMYVPGSSLRSTVPGETVTMAGSNFYFDEMPELQFFKASAFRPKAVEFRSTPGDPKNKASMKLFGMNLKLSAKPSAAQAAQTAARDSVLKDTPDTSATKLRLDELRRKYHGK
jgi:hypothetical protein